MHEPPFFLQKENKHVVQYLWDGLPATELVTYVIILSEIAKRTDDVKFMFVRLYNLFLHFQQKKMAH
jgi:hypothetical protein